MKYECVASHRQTFPVLMMCRLLNVTASGFYAWLRRGPSARRQFDGRLKKQISAIHAESDGIYGSPKVRDELLGLGFSVGRRRVARLMRELGIHGCPKRRYRVTTSSDHGYRVAPNHLNREFAATEPNQRWAGDITYIPTL